MGEPVKNSWDDIDDDGGEPLQPLIIDDAPSNPEELDTREQGRDSRPRLAERGLPLGDSADDLKIVDHEPPAGEYEEVLLTPADSGFHRVSITRLPPSQLEPHSPAQLAELETLLSMGRWEAICQLLGPPVDVARLPVAFQIIYGIACRETARAGDTTSETDALVIAAVARLLGVPAESPVAFVLAKRALRSKRPWSKREAPHGPLSWLILVVGLGLGGLVGWLLTFLL